MKHKYWLEAVLLCGVMQSAPAQSILKKDQRNNLRDFIFKHII